jgi:uncharacterized protein YhfF
VRDGMAVCEPGNPGPMRDRLVRAVLSGEKTATTSLLSERKLEGEPFPLVGDRQIVVDSDGHRVAVIEIVRVEVIRLGDGDIDLAAAEGEGFPSASEWRSAHEGFWSVMSESKNRQRLTSPLADDTPIVVEHFRLVPAASS